MADEEAPFEILSHLAAVVADQADTGASSSRNPTDLELVDYVARRFLSEPRREEIARHVSACQACQEKVEKLQARQATKLQWSQESLRAYEERFVRMTSQLIFVGNGWYQRIGGQIAQARLRLTDLTQWLGDWCLTGGSTSFAMAQGGPNPPDPESLTSLELTVDVAADLRISLTVTPTYIASEFEDVWLLRIGLESGNPARLVRVNLFDQDKRSRGIRSVRSARPATYWIAPPADGSYSLKIVWNEDLGKTNGWFERVLDLPLLAGRS